MPDVFQLANELWVPQARGIQQATALLMQGKSVCLYGPTGSGKTRVAIELFKWAEYLDLTGCFYVNRKLLIGQTAKRFTEAGLDFGIRAADYEDEYRLNARFQICSADTERSRVIERKTWNLHRSGIVIVDECFPAGTLVDGRRIETIRAGDVVTSYDHHLQCPVNRRVAATKQSRTESIVSVEFSSGRVLNCTENHPIWVSSLGSYIEAFCLVAGDEVLYAAEIGIANRKDLCGMRAEIPVRPLPAEEFLLQQGMQGKDDEAMPLRQGGCSEWPLQADDGQEPHENPWRSGEGTGYPDGHRAQASCSRRERTRTHFSGVENGEGAWMADKCDSENRMPAIGEVVPDTLQDRRRVQLAEDRSRNRRQVSLDDREEDSGQEEGGFFEVDRVVSVTVHERGSGPEFERLCPGGFVFNIEVEEHHNYLAGGYLVHNCHIQKSDAMRWLLMHHRENGAMIVLLTATPIGLSEWADELVISGTMQEYRDCKALVPAKVFTIEQPDMSKVKRNATGEFVIEDRKRKIYTQSIVASVIDSWKQHNPDARPTMMYAPGKPESVWLTEQFRKAGVNFCHVDATDAVVDGERYTLNRPLWEDILGRYRDGQIKGLSSRFKLREGIDVPATYHCILATPIGSLASYIQTVGRVLRYSPETPEHVVVTDHGGNYLRHGSPNHDRAWADWWRLPEHAVSEWHTNQIRDGKIAEPIRCPKCGMERTGGIQCPNKECGHKHEKSKRVVIMEDGRLVEREGRLVRARHIRKKPDTAQIWERMFWGWKKKKLDRSFAQLYGYFTHEHGYSPPKDLPYMPRNTADWYAHVHRVPMGNLFEKRT